MTQSSSGISVTPARRYASEVGRGWPVGVAPQPGELLSSWLHRLALANGVPSRYFGRVLGFNGAGWPDRLDRALPEHVLNLLADQTGVPADIISGLALGPDPLVRLRLRLKIKSRKGPSSTPQMTRLQYCPTCLAEDQTPYFRRDWTLATRVSCFRHTRLLRDRCPHCEGAIAPSRQNRLLPQHVCVWCAGDLRKRTRRVEHNVPQFEQLIGDLLRLHVAGHSLPGKTALPVLLGAACFTLGAECKSIAQMPLRDRHRLFSQLVDGVMLYHLHPDHRATALWAQLAQAAPKHTELSKSFTAKVMARTTPRRDSPPARPNLSDLLQAINRIYSSRRVS